VQISLNRGVLPHEMFMERICLFARDVLPRLQALEVERVPLAGEVDNVLGMPKDDSSFKRARRRRHRRIERRKPAAFSGHSRGSRKCRPPSSPRRSQPARRSCRHAASWRRLPIRHRSIFWLSRHRRAGKL
jgi:hypothetical protein